MNYLEIIKRYSIFSMAPLLTAIIQLFSVFLIGHSLSNQQLGLSGIFNTLIFILVFLSDGGSSNYFIFRKILTNREVRVINTLNIFFSVLCIILYCSFSPITINISLAMIFCFLTISIAITLPLYNYSRLLVEKRFNTIASIELTSKLIFLLSLVVMLYFFKSQGVFVVYSWTISYIIRFIMFTVACKNINLFLANGSNIDVNVMSIIKKWWAYVHNQIFSQILNYITLTADIFIISHFGGLERVGVYSLCKDATLKISAVISPVISKLLISHVVTSNISQIRKIYMKVFLSILLIALCIFITWSLAGPLLLQKLRSELEPGFEIFIYSWAVCGVFRMLINPIASIFQGLGETRKELYINVISSLSFALIFLLLEISNVMDDVINVVLVSLMGMYLIAFVYSSWILKKRFLKI